MDEAIEDLRGRIDGVAQALMWIAAGLEMAGVMDGPRMSAAWRARQVPVGTSAALAAASLRTLGQMADELDAARAARRSRGDPA